MVFNYTLVSDPGANEIPSAGEGSIVTFGQLGDVNSDGTINVVDIVIMVNFALQIDVPRLAQEALKDIIKEYRLLSNSSKAIPSSVADANALGVPYNFNTSN